MAQPNTSASLVSAITDDEDLAKSTKQTQIVEAAAALFLRSGFGAVSMDMIAATANVSKRTVYSYFSTKEALFVAVMDALCQQMAGPDDHAWSCPISDLAYNPDTGCMTAAPSDAHNVDAHNDSALTPADRIIGTIGNQTVEELLTAIGMRFLKILSSAEGVQLYRIVIHEADRFPDLGRNFYKYGCVPLIERLSDLLKSQHDAGLMYVPGVTDSAWLFFSMIKDPIHMQLCVSERMSVTEKEIEDHVDSAVQRFLIYHAPRQRQAV